jgi:hypothetical protein
MKKSARILYLNGNFLKLLLLTALLATSSCVSTKTRVMSQDEMELRNAVVVGKVETKFGSFQPVHTYSAKSIGYKAYKKLMVEANEMFPKRNVDVVNIKTFGEPNSTTWLLALLFYPTLIFGNYQAITATGDVIAVDATAVARVQQARPSAPPPAEPRVEPRHETRAPTASNATSGMEEVIKRATSKMMNEIPRGSKIAVVEVATDDWEIASTVIDEIEYNFVSSKRYTVVDRKTLDVIRSEQKLQTSGAVSDETIVKIGALSGANVVIAGSLTKSGGSNRLSLRALDVQTGQIITMARESY